MDRGQLAPSVGCKCILGALGQGCTVPRPRAGARASSVGGTGDRSVSGDEQLHSQASTGRVIVWAKWKHMSGVLHGSQRC